MTPWHKRIWPIWTVLFTVFCAAGCTGQPRGEPLLQDDPVGSSIAQESDRDPLGLQTNGLQLRIWRISDDTDRIGAAMLHHANGSALSEEAQQQLARNGLRLVRLPTDQLESLKVALGGSAVTLESWHGQAYTWREIAAQPVPPDGILVGIDGRVRRLEFGRLRMMMRGWTIPMEDGPAFHFELLPDIDRTQTTRFEQMLGRRTFRGERFGSMRLDLLLEPGFAYAMVAEPPGAKWDQEAEPDAERGSRASAPDDAHQTGTRPLIGLESIGPAAAAPLTLGELLLPKRSSSGVRTRDVLVFIPRVPDAMMPVQRRERSAMNAGGES